MTMEQYLQSPVFSGHPEQLRVQWDEITAPRDRRSLLSELRLRYAVTFKFILRIVERRATYYTIVALIIIWELGPMKRAAPMKVVFRSAAPASMFFIALIEKTPIMEAI